MGVGVGWVGRGEGVAEEGEGCCGGWGGGGVAGVMSLCVDIGVMVVLWGRGVVRLRLLLEWVSGGGGVLTILRFAARRS